MACVQKILIDLIKVIVGKRKKPIDYHVHFYFSKLFVFLLINTTPAVGQIFLALVIPNFKSY